MIKYLVRIGIKRVAASFGHRGVMDDVKYLMEVLNVPKPEADTMVHWMHKSKTDHLTIKAELTPEQIGNYTAQRQLQDLRSYWVFPAILDEVQSDDSI